ncbi:MAG: hypothetical protein KKE51_02860 [Gammaproteobacteria bacterium]|nr:hypothetical protein [Gammaproteobacteria bacterium]MBU1603057.1 hypothetical protein [Gammaproteobacteria bacterium]MBU2433762.1 hypothetical protein [Gammaproteobacteria bacterium]MBU2449932.1 hypothetical protein [Gammaproteobacteria bacterium]
MQAEKALARLGYFGYPVRTSLSPKLPAQHDEKICRIRDNNPTSSVPYKNFSVFSIT